jgi:hypothetical protein
MPSLRDRAKREQIVQRVERLAPAAQPRWGKFDAPRMVCHVNDSLAVALGEIPSRSMNKRAFQHFPLKHLAIYVVPFPKSAPAPAEMMTTAPTSFDTDRDRLVGLINRLAAAPADQRSEHPLFGLLTMDEWNALQWKHIDHHLRQFGC